VKVTLHLAVDGLTDLYLVITQFLNKLFHTASFLIVSHGKHGKRGIKT
jgi:hypothetical protein